MRAIIPVLIWIALTGLILSGVLLFASEWSFSILFKSALLFLSALIGLLAHWKSSRKLYTAILGLVGFGGTVLLLFRPELYYSLWNLVLALHTLLAGYTLLKLSQFSSDSVIFRVSQIAVTITSLIAALIFIAKPEQEWIFLVLFVLLAATSILFIFSQLYGMIKASK